MSEGFNIVLIGILGVFGNLLILMALMSLLGRIAKAMARAPEGNDDTKGRAVT